MISKAMIKFWYYVYHIDKSIRSFLYDVNFGLLIGYVGLVIFFNSYSAKNCHFLVAERCENDHQFSTFNANLSEKLIFLTLWYLLLRARIRR